MDADWYNSAIQVTMVSKADVLRGASIEVGCYVAPEFLDDAENAKEYLKAKLRKVRDEAAQKRRIDPSKVTWSEQWYKGPSDMERQVMEDRPLIRLDW